MNRLLNKVMTLGFNQFSPKLLMNESIKSKAIQSRNYSFLTNECILNSKTLLSAKRVLFCQRINDYSNGKTERKVNLKSDKTSIESEFQSLVSKKRLFRKKAVINSNDKLSSVLAFSTAEEYSIEDMAEALKEQGLYELLPLSDEEDDVLHISAKYLVNDVQRDAFVFREGSIVCWNMPSVECEAILKFIKPFEQKPYEQTIIDEEREEMNFEFVNSKTKLQKGLICLNQENVTDLEKYSFSNAIALSVKLSIWETSLDRYIRSIEFVSQDMKEGQKIRLTRDQVFRKTGELFDLKHDINLSSDLLDTPDFYWDRQELERIFLDTIYYLNIRKRTNVTNEKLNHCIELMELLASHLNDIHHVRLEWMIIVLIMVEVVFEFIHYAERLF